jgi:hypothetical protein
MRKVRDAESPLEPLLEESGPSRGQFEWHRLTAHYYHVGV